MFGSLPAFPRRATSRHEARRLPSTGELALACLAALSAACSTTSGGTTVTPVTTLVVPADRVTETRGCGPGTGRIFKYAALVTQLDSDGGAPTRGVARGLYDCYVDATFANLPLGLAGAPYRIDLVAVDDAGYASQKAALDAIGDAAQPLDVAAFDQLKGALFECEATMRRDVTTTAFCRSRGTR